MDQFFTSLSKRQTMLLLTGVTFAGHDCLDSFDFLVGYEADLLRYRAQELLQIPRERRIPLLVQEIKRLVTARPSELYAADPAKLAEVLAHERVAVREILLSAFPEPLALAVRALLPKAPPWRPARSIRPEILASLRWRLEEVLRTAGARRGHFKFSDVLLLQTRELLTLCDHLGARTLGPALAGLDDSDRRDFIARLGPDLQVLANRAIEGAGRRKLSDRDAEDLLGLYAGEHGPQDNIRGAGAQKLARACLAQSPEFAARLLERQRGEFGALLVRWVREERAKAISRGDGGRTEVVQMLEELEQLGLVSKPPRMPTHAKSPSGSVPLADSNPKSSSKVPLAAQARGASASAQFRAAAEAASPRQAALGAWPQSNTPKAPKPITKPRPAKPPSAKQLPARIQPDEVTDPAAHGPLKTDPDTEND